MNKNNIKCPECNSEMELKSSKYGKFYGCINYPNCNGTHGADPYGNPLGIPGNSKTKEARREAHKIFDSLCEKYNFTKAKSYLLLADIMQLNNRDSHIAMFNQDDCNNLINKLQKISDKEFIEYKNKYDSKKSNKISVVKNRAYSYQDWTEESENELLEFHKQGLTAIEIAKKLNRTKGAISSRLKKIRDRVGLKPPVS